MTNSKMKFLTDWGLNRESWRGGRGEYWVLLQGLLMVGFVLLPVYRPWDLGSAGLRWTSWGVAAMLGMGAIVLIGKGLLDLGKSLTPLPYPREDGVLVQTGVYGIVRHCLYGGLILGALAGSIALWSLSHMMGVAVLFVFFDTKASKEEVWLQEKYPEYTEYRQRVKKLIPWVY